MHCTNLTDVTWDLCFITCLSSDKISGSFREMQGILEAIQMSSSIIWGWAYSCMLLRSILKVLGSLIIRAWCKSSHFDIRDSPNRLVVHIDCKQSTLAGDWLGNCHSHTHIYPYWSKRTVANLFPVELRPLDLTHAIDSWIDCTHYMYMSLFDPKQVSSWI